MKPNTNYVDGSKLLAVVTEKGNSTKDQAGFIRVESKSCPGCRLYVAKTKRVGRIDLSGFEVNAQEFGVRDLGGEAFGNVHQQVDFSVDEGTLLANFGKLLDHINSLPATAAPKRSSKPAGERKPKAKKETTEQAAPPTEAETRRTAIMARAQLLVAQNNGMTIAEAVGVAQGEYEKEHAASVA